jgi:hypothetical protein
MMPSRSAASVKNFLHPLIEARIEQARVFPFVCCIAPLIEANVERVFQQPVKVALGVALSRFEANLFFGGKSRDRLAT